MNLLLLFIKGLSTDPAFGGFNAGQVGTFFITIAVALLLITLIASLVGPIIYSALNIKDSWKGILGMGIFALIGYLFYTTGDGTLTAKAAELKVLPWQMKLVSGFVTMTVVLVVATFAMLLFSVLRDTFSGFFN